MIAQVLLALSATIVLVAGALHTRILLYGTKLHPQDPSFRERMKVESLVITSKTTIWNAWIGFNIGHGLGMMLFGLLYAYLAAFKFIVFQQAPVLLLVGMLFLGGLVALAKRYLFSTPFVLLTVTMLLYATGALFAIS